MSASVEAPAMSCVGGGPGSSPQITAIAWRWTSSIAGSASSSGYSTSLSAPIRQVGLILECGRTHHHATGPFRDLGCRVQQRGLSHARLAAEEQNRRRGRRIAPHEGADQIELGVPPEEHAHRQSARSIQGVIL